MRVLSERNGYASVRQLMSAVFGCVKREPHHLTPGEVKLMTGHSCAPNQGVQLLYDNRHRQPHYHYGHLSIPEHHLLGYDRYCPECLSESGIQLAKWRIGWLPLCTRHECLLIPVDSNLNKPNVDLIPDDLFREDYIAAQKRLEERLERECLDGACEGAGIVEAINRQLVRLLGLDKASELWELKRRYPMKYYPLNEKKTLHLIHSIYTEEQHRCR